MSVIDSRLEGFEPVTGYDAFEDYIGPLYCRREDGAVRCAFIAEPKHINGQKSLHGGMLMSFADFALFMVALESLNGQSAVTVSFNSEFIATAGVGEFIEAEGEIVRETGSLIFVRGTVLSAEATLLNFSAVLKKFKRRS